MTMAFDPRTVGPRIRMMLPELTVSETRITEILLRGDGDAATPLKAIAEAAETSEAMVVKTAKRLGFSGYKELRAALQAYKSQPHVDLHQDVKPDDSAETIVQKVFRTSIQALEETLAILGRELLPPRGDGAAQPVRQERRQHPEDEERQRQGKGSRAESRDRSEGRRGRRQARGEGGRREGQGRCQGG